MMNEIQLAQWRDIAIEYLPAAQKARDNFKQWQSVKHLNQTDYALKLCDAAIRARGDATLPPVELAATRLLEAVSVWTLYDPIRPGWEEIDPTEYRADCMRRIKEAANALAVVTGRTIPFDYVEPADAPATVEQVAPAKAKARGGRPKTIDKKVFAVREMMTRFERVASIKFTPKALSGSAVDLLDACQRFERSNKIKPLIFSTSQDTFNHWLKRAGYSFPTGRTPDVEKNYWTQLVVKVSV